MEAFEAMSYVMGWVSEIFDEASVQHHARTGNAGIERVEDVDWNEVAQAMPDAEGTLLRGLRGLRASDDATASRILKDGMERVGEHMVQLTAKISGEDEVKLRAVAKEALERMFYLSSELRSDDDIALLESRIFAPLLRYGSGDASRIDGSKEWIPSPWIGVFTVQLVLAWLVLLQLAAVATIGHCSPAPDIPPETSLGFFQQVALKAGSLWGDKIRSEGEHVAMSDAIDLTVDYLEYQAQLPKTCTGVIFATHSLWYIASSHAFIHLVVSTGVLGFFARTLYYALAGEITPGVQTGTTEADVRIRELTEEELVEQLRRLKGPEGKEEREDARIGRSATVAHICDSCGVTKALYRCKVCKAEYYCSEACQRTAWSLGHESRCLSSFL